MRLMAPITVILKINSLMSGIGKQPAQTNDSLRIRLYQKMDSLVMYEAPVVPLYYDQVLRFYPKSIKGLEGNAMNLLDLKRVQKP